MIEVMLWINGEQIGHIYTRRLTPWYLPAGSGDTVCTYEWRLNINGSTHSGEEPLSHRYGDGAWALVAKIIKEAGKGPRDQALMVEDPDYIDTDEYNERLHGYVGGHVPRHPDEEIP